jgi:membrane-associated phospholipid phosphatase
MCAYAVNDGILKLFFGVPGPGSVLSGGAQHVFHFLAGAGDSSFPSGHMVLAASFGGVFMRLHPASIWPLTILFCCGAALLILGDWHFVSDVIAGAFVGVSAGLLAGELWRAHSS